MSDSVRETRVESITHALRQAPRSLAAGDEPDSLALPKPSIGLALAAEQARVFEGLFQQAAPLNTFGRYVILDALGEGSMGTVLRAFDRELDRPVALKVLRDDLGEQNSARLRREARALAKLSHPNVVQVYEVGQMQGRTFVAMELVKGRSVSQWIHQQPRPDWRACVKVFIQLGEGLAAVHAKGLVHRDFKPDNTIIDEEGRARVLDFGLARSIHEGADEGADRGEPDGPAHVDRGAGTVSLEAEALETSLTRSGTILGTPAYMPKEQLNGQEADARSDQFSFCVSLFEAVYGQRPFEGGSLYDLAVAIETGKIRPAPQGSDVPAALRTVLLRGLATAPADRWPSMNALLEQLRRVMLAHAEPTDALPALERALSLCTIPEINPSLLATTRFVLARTLWTVPGPRGHEVRPDRSTKGGAGSRVKEGESTTCLARARALWTTAAPNSRARHRAGVSPRGTVFSVSWSQARWTIEDSQPLLVADWMPGLASLWTRTERPRPSGTAGRAPDAPWARTGSIPPSRSSVRGAGGRVKEGESTTCLARARALWTPRPTTEGESTARVALARAPWTPRPTKGDESTTCLARARALWTPRPNVAKACVPAWARGVWFSL